jgi:hypothetical protein
MNGGGTPPRQPPGRRRSAYAALAAVDRGSDSRPERRRLAGWPAGVSPAMNGGGTPPRQPPGRRRSAQTAFAAALSFSSGFLRMSSINSAMPMQIAESATLNAGQ